jgi:hypothetical protein
MDDFRQICTKTSGAQNSLRRCEGEKVAPRRVVYPGTWVPLKPTWRPRPPKLAGVRSEILSGSQVRFSEEEISRFAR